MVEDNLRCSVTTVLSSLTDTAVVQLTLTTVAKKFLTASRSVTTEAKTRLFTNSSSRKSKPSPAKKKSVILPKTLILPNLCLDLVNVSTTPRQPMLTDAKKKVTVLTSLLTQPTPSLESPRTVLELMKSSSDGWTLLIRHQLLPQPLLLVLLLLLLLLLFALSMSSFRDVLNPSLFLTRTAKAARKSLLSDTLVEVVTSPITFSLVRSSRAKISPEVLLLPLELPTTLLLPLREAVTSTSLVLSMLEISTL
mmetsp:Transcript_15556/g.39154  ORF Transcript_15556/g.39154 Transcript_15556/m.39154 type:complete len:251 (-) Transcript_15556:1626-2378(-)